RASRANSLDILEPSRKIQLPSLASGQHLLPRGVMVERRDLREFNWPALPKIGRLRRPRLTASLPYGDAAAIGRQIHLRSVSDIAFEARSAAFFPLLQRVTEFVIDLAVIRARVQREAGALGQCQFDISGPCVHNDLTERQVSWPQIDIAFVHGQLNCIRKTVETYICGSSRQLQRADH